jgi:hypothetical protein
MYPRTHHKSAFQSFRFSVWFLFLSLDAGFHVAAYLHTLVISVLRAFLRLFGGS